MRDWRIEPAKTGRGQCKHCRKRVEQGALRFGQDGGTTASWFHLHCASLGAPRAFKPFAVRAAQLLRGEAKSGASAPNPDDSSLEVLADWLQEQGDPWGTLIALRLARKHAEAREFLFEHEAALCGSFAARDLEWRDGLIVGARLSGANLEGPLRSLLVLPAAARLERLSLCGNVSPVLATLSRYAPPTLVWLQLEARRTRGVGTLHLPRLEQLTLVFPSGAVESVLEAKLPALRALRLDVSDGTAPPLRFFERLLASALLTRLEELEFSPRNALNGEALRSMLAKVNQLAHLQRLTVPYEDWTLGASQRALATKHFKARRARALKASQEQERRYDESLDEVE